MDAGDVLDTPEAGRRIIRGGSARVVGFVFVTLLAVVGIALVTRHLGPAEFGQFQTVLALVTLVQMITDLGMAPLGIREYSQRKDRDRDDFMAVLLGLRLASTVVGVTVAVLIALALGYEPVMVAGTALLGTSVVLALLQGTLGIPLMTQLRVGTITALDLLRQSAMTVAYALLVAAGASLLAFYAVAVPVQVVLVLVTAALVRGVISLRPSFDPQAWLALIKPTLVFALAVTVGQVYIYSALVLTELVTSSYETGLFAASFRVYIIVAAVPGILVTTAFPLLSRAARDDRQRLSYATQRLFEGTAILGGAALLLCVLGAAPIIAVVAGSAFDEAVPVLRIQGVALAMTFVIATWGFSLLAVHHHRPMIIANVVAMTVSASTVIVLAATYGATGAAIATVLGEFTLAAGYALALTSVDRTMRPTFGRVARAVPALALGLGAGLLLPAPAVIQTTVAVGAYGVALLLFRAVPDELLEHVPGRLGIALRR